MQHAGSEPLSLGFPKFTVSFSFIRDLRGREGLGDTWQCIFFLGGMMSGQLFWMYMLGRGSIGK